MQQMNEETRKKVEEISKKVGIPVTQLLSTKTPSQIIEEYENGSLKVLND